MTTLPYHTEVVLKVRAMFDDQAMGWFERLKRRVPDVSAKLYEMRFGRQSILIRTEQAAVQIEQHFNTSSSQSVDAPTEATLALLQAIQDAGLVSAIEA